MSAEQAAYDALNAELAALRVQYELLRDERAILWPKAQVLPTVQAQYDAVSHAFEDFVIYVQGVLDIDACEGVSPESTEEYDQLVNPILARCDSLTTEWFA